MITITNNYFQDLNAAIAAGIFPINAKPKKVALYEAIATHNESQVETTIEAPTKKYEWVEVEVDRFDLPEGINRCDFVPGFHDWFTAAGKYSRVEGGVHEGYIAYDRQRVEVEPVDMLTCSQPDITTLEAAGDEAAVQAALLAMDTVEDEAQAEQQAQVKAMKKTRKLAPTEQAQKNAQDLMTYRTIVELKEAIGAGKAAAQLTAEGRKMGGTTVCQIATTYHKVLMASPVIQQLFNQGMVTWGELYARSRRIDIPAIEAEFSTRLPQAS